LSTAWLRALTYSVTVKRGETVKSASGSTKFVYNTVVTTGLACSLQDDGGRMEQDEFGNVPARKKRVIADVDFSVVQQNDLLEDEDTGETYKVVHTHYVNNPNAPHYEANVEQWVPAGDL
jgi:hypothetical protein